MTSPVKRPWQGTVLGIIAILYIVLFAISALMIIFLRDFFSEFVDLSDFPMQDMLNDIILALAVFCFIMSIFLFFVSKALFTGKKWSLIAFGIFSILVLWGALTEDMDVVSLGVSILSMVCIVMMWNDPFYGGDGKTTIASVATDAAPDIAENKTEGADESDDDGDD